MNRYDEFTVEEIEDLANEYERMGDENDRLRDINAELLEALKACRHCAVQLDDKEACNAAEGAIAKAEASGLTPP